MFLATTPLLLAAAAVASPEFAWLDGSLTRLDYAPQVFVAPTGDALVAMDDTILYGQLGTPLTDISGLVPSPDGLAAGVTVDRVEAVGMTDGGAVLLRMTLETPTDVLGAPACSALGANHAWMAWDPFREIAPVTFEQPAGGYILDVYAVNGSSLAAGLAMTPEGVRGATWHAGSLAVMPEDAFAFSACNGGWLYGESAGTSFGPVATVWTPEGDPVVLGTLAGDDASTAACGVNGVTFGTSGEGGDGDTLFRWTPDGTAVPFAQGMSLHTSSALADLPPTPSGRFASLYTARCEMGPAAFLVDEVRGALDVGSMLPTDATADEVFRFVSVETVQVNGQGDVLFGVVERGTHDHTTFGVFTLGVEFSPADVELPFGVLDVSDIDAFVTGFVNGLPAGDLNRDGVFDLTDMDLFVEAWLGQS